MSCGEVKITITPPTAGSRKPSQAQLSYQVAELDRLLRRRALESNMTEGTRSFLQNLANAQVMHFGWLDGGVSVELCHKEPQPVTLSIGLSFQQRKKVQGEWSEWQALNLNDPMKGLSKGDVIQRRSMARGDGWYEGPEVTV